MKTLILVAIGLALSEAESPEEMRFPFVPSQFHAQNELGHYSYGYNAGFSNKAEYRSLDGVTRGSYNYVDSDGKLQTVDYTADALNGFQVKATNLPELSAIPEPVMDTPEVAQAKAEHMAALEREKLRTNQLLSGMPLAKLMDLLPKPVEDTPEVAKAKRDHMEAVKMIETRNLELASLRSITPMDNSIVAPVIPARFAYSFSKDGSFIDVFYVRRLN